MGKFIIIIKNGGEPMNQIKCSVSSCKYNDNGDECKADAIKVRNNFGATDNMELGSLDEDFNARTSMETCCETFAPQK
jgi:hypothetical protein